MNLSFMAWYGMRPSAHCELVPMSDPEADLKRTRSGLAVVRGGRRPANATPRRQATKPPPPIGAAVVGAVLRWRPLAPPLLSAQRCAPLRWAPHIAAGQFVGTRLCK